MKNSGTLFMSGSSGSPHDPTTALNNGTTIKCLKANNLYLNLGINSLKPLNIGQQKTLNGTLLFQNLFITTSQSKQLEWQRWRCINFSRIQYYNFLYGSNKYCFYRPFFCCTGSVRAGYSTVQSAM
jgi:hypothetical protein